MNTPAESTVRKKRLDWREDLANSRDLTRREIDGYGYVLSWIEDWRVKKDLVAGREAAKRWWLEVAKEKERPEWQFRQWAEAIRWFLGWLEICAKAGGDARTIPERLKDALGAELARAREFWEEDREKGTPGVALPGALSRKMPKAGIKWAWMWIFPADHLSEDPESGIVRRHHLHPKSYGEAIARAAGNAGIAKRVTTHALRHAFATDLLAGGTDIRTLQELLGHADVKTTEIYAHAAEIGNGKGVRSPLDR